MPILAKLQSGEKLDFSTLADNIEETYQYWDWWWDEKSKGHPQLQPEIIEDNDPILTETISKDTVDLYSLREFFDSQLLDNPDICAIRPRVDVSRDYFRSVLGRIGQNGSTVLEGPPQIIFTGGGYGSGKTTAVNWLAACEQLPVRPSDLVGADVFRQLIPEYNLIKAVGDGRASFTVHRECCQLTDHLFEALIEARRSFVFDSSMGHKANALKRIQMAKQCGYSLMMVAVLAPLEQAMRLAIRRAKLSRRFPIFSEYEESHRTFIQELRNYFPYFDKIKVLANLGEIEDIKLVAEKKPNETLEILDSDVFNSPPFMPMA